MKPIENTFEEEPILALPPLAQRVAYDLFSTWSLPQLMEAWVEDKRPDDVLKMHNCPPRFWPDILSATFVAKTTYFLPNPNFNAHQVNYLIRLTCTHIGFPLNEYSLAEVVGIARHKYPVLYEWLKSFINLINQKKASHG